MAVDDVYLLALRQSLNGQPVVNTFALRRMLAAEPTASNFQGLAGAIANIINDVQVDDLTYDDWRAQQVRGAGTTYSTTPPFQVSTVSYSGGYSAAITGALTASPLPNNVAMTVTLNTSQSGRRRKGRIYIGGIGETWVDDNSTFNPTQLATAQTQLDALVALIGEPGSSTEWEWGVWSHRIATNAAYVNTVNGPVLTSQGTPSPSTAFAAIISATCRDYVGSQRDRRPGL